MKRFIHFGFIVITISLLSWPVGCAGFFKGISSSEKRVDTRSLLEEMTDLRELSIFPNPAFTCRQFSSYDRKSESPDKDWFANYDRGQYLGEEKHADPRPGEAGEGRTEYVMMDADGPGAIVRIWSANPAGTLRIYIDRSPEPVVEEEMASFLSGKSVGFPFPICHMVSKGWNSYYPIPYRRHCKVTSDANDFYYQINYRTYNEDADVISFDEGTALRLKDEAEAVARKLAAPRTAFLPPISRWTGQTPDELSFEITLDHGKSGSIVSLSGERAICSFELAVHAADSDAALRGLVLGGVFDRMRTITVPLGDFFGAAPGLNVYESLPAGVAEDGTLWSRWWMPFREKADLFLENLSGQEITVRGKTVSVPSDWTERTMHFHAKWRMEKDIPTRPMKDWNYLETTGRGVFVGDALYVTNPVKTWWGEGDEKIYVDGETFPSHFGTGTEDYYGYAWCWPEPFTHAYHNQPRCDGPGNYGHTAVNRWHVLDRIPYLKSFRFDMEVWHWKDVLVDYAVTSYWYAFPQGRDNIPLPDRADLALALLPPYTPRRVEGAIEGEEMEVVSKTGIAEKQTASEKYSGECHLWWRDAEKGDTLTLAFESKTSGPAHVIAVFTKAPDYGIHRITVNGRKVEGDFDLYKEGEWGPTGEIDLGFFDIKKGRNLITVTVIGTNDKADPKFMFGMDYLKITGGS